MGPFTEEVVGKHACLWEPIATADYFEVNPAFVCPCKQVVLIDEFLRDVCKYDVYIFRSFHWRGQVEVFYIEACKFSIRL